MQFWHSAEVLLHGDDLGVGPKNCKYELVGSRRIDGNEVPVDKIGEANMVMIIYFDLLFWSLLYCRFSVIYLSCYFIVLSVGGSDYFSFFPLILPFNLSK